MQKSRKAMPLSVASSAFPSRTPSPARPPALPSHLAPGGQGGARQIKTVLVLGGSYSGAHAAEVLAKELPRGWRVVMVERNSHFHHVYHFPRYGVLPEHAHKAFIPYTHLLHRPLAHPSPNSTLTSSPAPLSASHNPLELANSGQDHAIEVAPELFLEQSEVEDPDRLVEAVAGLADAQTAVENSSSASGAGEAEPPFEASPERHRVVQASVVRIGRGFVSLDRKVSTWPPALALASVKSQRSPSKPSWRVRSKLSASTLVDEPAEFGRVASSSAETEADVEGRCFEDWDSGYGDSVAAYSAISAEDSAPWGAPLAQDVVPSSARWRERSAGSDGLRRVSGGSYRKGGGRRGEAEEADDDGETAGEGSDIIEWDFLIYALGSHLPPPLQLPFVSPSGALVAPPPTEPAGRNSPPSAGRPLERTKASGVAFLKQQGEAIAKAKKVVVVGGGALGIQYATDIASTYPSKEVVLVHSRHGFLPQYSPKLNEAVLKRFKELGVGTKLGERVDLEGLRKALAEREERREGGEIEVKGVSGNVLTKGDVILLCTGQSPNAGLLSQFCPSAVPGGSQQSGGCIKVLRSMQIAPSRLGPSPVDLTASDPVGCDCADPNSRPTNPGVRLPVASPLSAGSGQGQGGGEPISLPLPKRNRVQQSKPSPPIWYIIPAPPPTPSPATSDASCLAPLCHPVLSTPSAPNAYEEAGDPLWKRVFAVGDCADAFGAIKAGHTGWNQAEVATKNILRLVEWESRGGKVEDVEVEGEGEGESGGQRVKEGTGGNEATSGHATRGRGPDDVKLLRYEPSRPMMKLTLGVDRMINQLVSLQPPYDLEVSEHIKGSADEGYAHMWRAMGLDGDNPWL